MHQMSVVGCNLNKSYPARADSVPAVRRALCELATAAGATAEQVESIRLAASEAVTNAVVHAYRDRAGEIHVTAAAVLDEFWILIGDDGCGMRVRSDSPGLGLGLMLISQECDDFTVLARSSGGTEVRMRFDLVGVDERRPGAQARGSEAAASRPASSRFSTTT
jgi:anti-sigma regulatory factor (Ser/Thr protein kinase)